MKFNIFIDGTWLLKICAPNKILATRTETPTDRFKLDFQKLLIFIRKKLEILYPGEIINNGDFYLFSSIIDIDENSVDPTWGDISSIRNNSYARNAFITAAEHAGFDISGVYHVSLKKWIVEALRNDSYQEKMVDTSLVAKLVEQTIVCNNDIQVVVAGDLDILPGIKTVIPDYSRKLILVTSHPQQFDPATQTTSFSLSNFDFEHAPIYLENGIQDIVEGNHVYQCCNPSCNRIFSRYKPIPKQANPMCYNCLSARSHITV